MTLTRILQVAIAALWLVMMSLLVRQEVFRIEGGGRRVPLDFLVRLFFEQGQTSELEIRRDGSAIGSLEISPLPEEVSEGELGVRFFINSLFFSGGERPLRFVTELKFFFREEDLSLQRATGWIRARNVDETGRFDLDFQQEILVLTVGEGGGTETWRGSFADAERELQRLLGGTPAMGLLVSGIRSRAGQWETGNWPGAIISQMKVRGETVETYRVPFDRLGFPGDLYVNLVGQVLLVRTPFEFELSADEALQPPPL